MRFKYTILRLEYNELITYMMILTGELCNNYDFPTYDNTKSLFVDESFTTIVLLTKRMIIPVLVLWWKRLLP